MSEPTADLGAELRRAHPELDPVAEAAAGQPTYLVGGAVRDLLLGRGRADVDLVVIGDVSELAGRLGASVIAEHERFATAKVELDGHEIDIASARSETYPSPGALPSVEPAAAIEEDLGRRDFTINAMAIELSADPELIDPHGGQRDLTEGAIRVLHDRSFLDDPTRALRAARYASRFGFEPDPATAALLRVTDLSTVSEDRRRAGLLRLAGEAHAARGFELLSEWGLIQLRPGAAELARRVEELLSAPPWRDLAPRDQAVYVAALGSAGVGAELTGAPPGSPSAGTEIARRHDPVELVLARALGAEWLDTYLRDWRSVRLEIDGDDLLAAGVKQGPAIGDGLESALRRKLDGEVRGREQELRAALEAVGEGGR